MDFQLYTEVVLQADIPEESLRAGDIDTIVDRHDVAVLDPGYSVEFCQGLRQTD